MRDLKHLIYFENLLQEANNDLVKQAKSDGKLALGYTCYFMPEVLLDLPGCFSVRLRAPRCTSPDMATYYMSSRTCHYGRSLLERALEGGFNFLDAQLATETCTVTCRFQEHLQRMDIIQNEKFKCEFTDVPFKKTANSIDHYEAQLKAHVVDFLHDNYGVDTSDEAILKTIESHNELCRIVQEIGDYRKLDNPTITGYEFHVINLVTLTCPKYLIIDKLRETLEELRTREPDTKPAYRCKVLLAGSENDDPDFTKLIESCGAMVVADRYCFGSFPSREQIEILPGETAFDAICRHYLHWNQCARFMDGMKIDQRHDEVKRLVDEFHADGVVYENMKFCEFWSYEKVLASHILTEEMGVPCCTIEKEYALGSVGQLRTRFQAFVESLEIKKINS